MFTRKGYTLYKAANSSNLSGVSPVPVSVTSITGYSCLPPGTTPATRWVERKYGMWAFSRGSTTLVFPSSSLRQSREPTESVSGRQSPSSPFGHRDMECAPTTKILRRHLSNRTPTHDIRHEGVARPVKERANYLQGTTYYRYLKVSVRTINSCRWSV